MKKPAPARTALSIEGPLTDVRLLPPRVAAMREKILEACQSGDIDQLRPAIERNEVMPLFGKAGDRPKSFAIAIEFLRQHSYDGKGRETLLLLDAVFASPFAKVTRGPHVTYVWPAFALIPVKDVDAEMGVAMLKCIAFSDLVHSGFKNAPPYHRGEIGGDGTWHAFGVS